MIQPIPKNREIKPDEKRDCIWMMVQGSSCGAVKHKGIEEKEPALLANLPWMKDS